MHTMPICFVAIKKLLGRHGKEIPVSRQHVPLGSFPNAILQIIPVHARCMTSSSKRWPASLYRGLRSCRGPPMLATAATLVLPQLNGNGIGELLSRNYVFKAGFCAWLLAQTAKVKCVLSSHAFYT